MADVYKHVIDSVRRKEKKMWGKENGETVARRYHSLTALWRNYSTSSQILLLLILHCGRIFELHRKGNLRYIVEGQKILPNNVDHKRHSEDFFFRSPGVVLPRYHNPPNFSFKKTNRRLQNQLPAVSPA